MVVISSAIAVGPISSTLRRGKPVGGPARHWSERSRAAEDLDWWVEAAKAQRARKPPPYWGHTPGTVRCKRVPMR
jgi:hypothetical protein